MLTSYNTAVTNFRNHKSCIPSNKKEFIIFILPDTNYRVFDMTT